MRLVYVIGVLVLLLFTVGSASAYKVIPVNVFKDEPGDPIPPDTAITATCDGNIITVQATPTGTATSLPTNFDITSIYLPVTYIDSASAGNTGISEVWTHKSDTMPTLGGFFGSFPVVSEWEGKNNVKSGGPIVITYPDIESKLTSIDGYSIVVKVSWNGDDSNWAGGNIEVPEFPSMVLPVAAILGLLFISQHRRKEN
ncbi:PEF-CTERM sorting domain-containing protein [Methanosarcina sp. MSH10X1]|uniref:PEF-CTERM sorting domain-containing protein n=1 Tax=Methanosarcina sp. MSH10X1 TaxID=2507075 RepID=UPI000FFB4FB7|nr:PEF-CTERM sorting domain-containing protein [Methanosarcina sp. MSH10X1]RXA21915.1 PEF-CTERM sorting domain-containing protein [Methanosarcina sp. MSH10X1]